MKQTRSFVCRFLERIDEKPNQRIVVNQLFAVSGRRVVKVVEALPLRTDLPDSIPTNARNRGVDINPYIVDNSIVRKNDL